jgi:hypothetical protein
MASRWAVAAGLLARAGDVPVPHPGDQQASVPEQPFQRPGGMPRPGDQGRDRHYPGDLAVFRDDGPVPQKGLAFVTV